MPRVGNHGDGDGRNGRHIHRPHGEPADYTSLDGTRMLRAIEAISRNGGAVRLGKTRDGGAYSIGIYGDGPEPYTEYFRPADDVVEALEQLGNSMSQLPTT